ncbi:MAG: dihydropteroate synthase [Cycloclasticus sp.]|nr:MAG: dihydropteroate synthase [Cycloclasticus sp.]
MGVLNITPDSFSDGGCFTTKSEAIRQAELMTRQGASIIDIGGESTRPGATPVSIDEELHRVIPVIEAIRSKSNMVISIDTSKPEVMKQAVGAGADIINDVFALRQPGALEMAASLKVPVCLMHMQSTPETMQHNPRYSNVIDEVKAFFEERINACEKADIEKSKIILDPGFGFGKKLEHNLSLLANLETFKSYGCPLLVGLSRKSMFGDLLGKSVNERALASVTAALLAVINGASIVRVHDVQETFDALKIYNAAQSLNL